MTAGFHECLAGKTFPRDTRETFCFANLSYLIHFIFTHTIYTYITHILVGVLFRQKTLAITLESERLSYPQSFTQSIVVFLNSYISISKSLRGDSPNTYHTYLECKVRFRCCWEALEEVICLVDAIRLNCVIQRAKEDKTLLNQLVARTWRA